MSDYIDRLDMDWNDKIQLIIWGYGTVARRTLQKLTHDFEIVCIIDNDEKKAGSKYNGIPIMTYFEAEKKYDISKYKIIVATSARWYHDISETLTQKGFEEFIHYCKLEQFISEWYWKNKSQVFLLRADTMVTTKCTLNCTHCNMFIPYYKEIENISYDSLKQNADLIFSNIDYIFYYILIGGEPFMNPDIGSIIEYIATNYSDKIGNIAIITNGTILIKDDVLDILNRFSVEISISDYTSEVNYTDTLRKLISRLDEKKVHYTVNQSILWNNFGFPEDLFSFETDDDTRRHMLSCSPLFLGINEGKICYCNVAWSAMKSKLFTTEEETFDLKILHGYEGRQRLLEYCMGDVPKGYLEFCKVCGGCGSDNNHFVDAGCQINRG